MASVTTALTTPLLALLILFAGCLNSVAPANDATHEGETGSSSTRGSGEPNPTTSLESISWTGRFEAYACVPDAPNHCRPVSDSREAYHTPDLAGRARSVALRLWWNATAHAGVELALFLACFDANGTSCGAGDPAGGAAQGTTPPIHLAVPRLDPLRPTDHWTIGVVAPRSSNETLKATAFTPIDFTVEGAFAVEMGPEA